LEKIQFCGQEFLAGPRGVEPDWQSHVYQEGKTTAQDTKQFRGEGRGLHALEDVVQHWKYILENFYKN
jgi:hypothetical protein